jgi:glyoxylase-like metal-dependent hydrolase (beta-lactamase superfamily II)
MFMLLRQLFDYDTYTYTYLLADKASGQALLIDPVLEQVPLYSQLLNELQLNLAAVLDTHVHADHVTAAGKLRELTGCKTYIAKQAEVDCANVALQDGDAIAVGGITLTAIYTPGHTSDSYSFLVKRNDGPDWLFTGDTLFIRGTGRSDFQNGSASDLFHSLFDRLLTLPPETVVYPGHDYRGQSVSTIGEERAHNPRLQKTDKAAFVAMMDSLDLPPPKHIQEAVPANKACGNR